jgi:hypothetical protein
MAQRERNLKLLYAPSVIQLSIRLKANMSLQLSCLYELGRVDQERHLVGMTCQRWLYLRNTELVEMFRAVTNVLLRTSHYDLRVS